jgi:hypothetical protein
MGLGRNATSREVKKIVTQTFVTTETIWNPAPTPKQCDGFPRVTSAGESTITKVTPVTKAERFMDNIPEPSSLPAFMYGPYIKPVPVCEIQPKDCSGQWNLVQNEFLNWSVKVGDINPQPDHTNPTCMFKGTELESICHPSDILNKTVNLNEWLDFRQFSHDRGFLGGCPQFESFCGHGMGVMGGTKDYDKFDRNCIVDSDRFVLVYFHTPGNASRDLCANGGYGDDIVISSENPSVTKTATLDQIVFPNREVRDGGMVFQRSLKRLV